MAEKKIAFCMSGINPEEQHLIMNSSCVRAEELGYNLCFFTSFGRYIKGTKHDQGEINIFNLVNFDLFDGLIIAPDSINHRETVEMLISKAKAANIPIVTVNQAEEGCYSIHPSHTGGLEQIINHFINHHKFTKINFISGMRGNDISEERIGIYKRVLEENNLPFEEERVDYGGFWEYPAQAVAERFMTDPKIRPQAIVCANDSMALGVCIKLQEMGYKVPEDVAVSGYDGTEQAVNHSPSITTASSSFNNAGICAVDLINDIINGKPVEKDTWLKPDINFTESCGCNSVEIIREKKTFNQLNMDITGANHYLSRTIRLNELMTGATSMEDAAQRFERSVRRAWCHRIWFFVVDDFISPSPDLHDHHKDDDYLKVGYGQNVEIFLSMKYKKRVLDEPKKIPVTSLLPDFQQQMDEFNNFIFTPLHFQDRVVGYAVMDYRPMDVNFHFFHFWFMGISANLENIRIQLEMAKLVERYKFLYTRDSLTGLLNRRGFYKEIQPFFEKAVNEKLLLCVVSIDLDDLKPINDLFGHSEGDVAIVTAANAFETACPDFAVSRFGGDEFVAVGIIPEKDSHKKNQEKFNETLNSYNISSGKSYYVGASWGAFSKIPDENSTIDDYIKKADEAMYSIKYDRKRGRNYRCTKR